MSPFPRIAGAVLLLALAVPGSPLRPSEAECRLSAEAELAYVNYDSKESASRHLSSHSLAQRYSLLYDTNGKIFDGRLGRYDFALGFEWADLDTSIKSTSGSDHIDMSRSHVMFRGEVVLDPKEMPLKLHLFSRDISRTFLTNDSSPLLTGFNQGTQIIGQPEVPTSIVDGQHIESGATLKMGVKNGMTNGYNEILRHFPMLLLDYRDQINKDVNTAYPVNNRLSRLAFVSLNKKDNWFHYRHTAYKDYIDSTNNYLETQFQLGTVDEGLQRRWIDFANWLQVSADGQLTRRVQLQNQTTEEFSLNLYGVARRETWEARSFNNFIRLKENSNLLTYKTTVPVYVSGTWGPAATWNAYATYNDNTNSAGSQFSTVSSGYKIDAFNKSPFTLNQGLSLEHVSDSNGMETNIIGATLGTNSTPLFSRDLGVGAKYTIRNYHYNQSANESNFIDQELAGNVRYSMLTNLILTLNQSNRFTSGRSQAIASSVSGSGTQTAQYIDPRNGSLSTGGGYQTITTAGLSWNPLPRLNLSVTASEDIYIPDGGARSAVTRVENNITYNSSNLTLRSKTTYADGYSYGNAALGNTASQISTDNSASYIFNRSMDGRVGLIYYKSLSGAEQSSQLRVEQAFNYYHYQTRGLARKLFEINELFESYGDISTAGNLRRNQLTLGFKYYPIRQMLVSAGTRYSFTNRLNNYIISYYGTWSVQFSLLEASLDYTYGTNAVDGRTEKRFSANVKKKF